MVLQQAESISEDAQRRHQHAQEPPLTPWPLIWAVLVRLGAVERLEGQMKLHFPFVPWVIVWGWNLSKPQACTCPEGFPRVEVVQIRRRVHTGDCQRRDEVLDDPILMGVRAE